MMVSKVHVTFTSQNRNAQKILVRKFQGNRPLDKLYLFGRRALHCILDEWD